MTSRFSKTRATVLRAQAEAATWMALLHSPERSAAIEAGLRRWIGEDPAHAGAWEVATELWNESAAFSQRPLQWGLAQRSPRVRMPSLLFGIVLMLLILSMIGWQLTDLRGNVISTAVGEQKTINLTDGSRVELNTDTHLLLKFDSHSRTVELRSGEAYFSVAHEPRPFVVLAGDRRVIAVGTAFTVRREPSKKDAITVTLIEGRVAVDSTKFRNVSPSPLGPDVVFLATGQRLRLRRDAPTAVDTPAMDIATGWMRGQIILDHTALREAAAEFNRYGVTRIEVGSAAVGQIPVGGIFRLGDAKSFARAVAQAHHLKLLSHDRQIVLEPPDSSAISSNP